MELSPKIILCCVFAFTLQKNRVQAQFPARPNIIFILADDLGYTDLGCYSNPYNETPHLDSLAKGGIRFTQAYAASTVCSPSRAAILTGKHPARLQLTNFLVGERTDSLSPVLPAKWRKYLPTEEKTLPEYLKTVGYQTGMIGKWHLGGADSLAPWGQGFDYTRMIGKNGLDYYNYSIYENNYQKEFKDNGTYYLTDKLSDYAVEFIDNQTHNQPFFLYLCYSAPHVMLVPRGDKLKKYLGKYEKFKAYYNPYYAAMIESMDDGVGRIMAQLQQQGLLNNTLVIFTSDNGGVGLAELGPIPTNQAPLRRWKGFVYEGGIRVPTILYWQGQIAPQQTCDQYFTNTDYLLTFLELLQQKKENLPDGKSFLPLLKNPQQPHDRGAIYWHYPHFSNQMSRPAGAMREGDWKLVEHYETGALELYNLRDDLSEVNNLADQYPEKVQQLHQKMLQWRQTVGASMPIRK
jgi:arylsulfatase A-like enzyme